MRKALLVSLGILVTGGLFVYPVFPAWGETVDIVVDRYNFAVLAPSSCRGIDCKVHTTYRGCSAEDVMSRLTKARPEYITTVPFFKGQEQYYGSLKLGNLKNNRFAFVIDIVSMPDVINMYFDLNRNGRLDDDGLPLTRKGKKPGPGEFMFSAIIEIPWGELAVDPPFDGTWQIWFFINNSQWALKGFSHYSRSHLKGAVFWDGSWHTVYIADNAETDNDCDLTNDGFHLLVSGEEIRYISAQEAKDGCLIDGVFHKFNISYGAKDKIPSAPRILKVEELLYDPKGKSSAKINGRVVSKGDVIEGFIVNSIVANWVGFKAGKKRFSCKVGKSIAIPMGEEDALREGNR